MNICNPWFSFKFEELISWGNNNHELQIRDDICFCSTRSSTNFIYLFGALRRFQHCTGHTTTGSCEARGNQYIQWVKVLYCKLLTNGKQLPAFPLEAVPGTEPPASEVGGESVTTLPPWPLGSSTKHSPPLKGVHSVLLVTKLHIFS